MLPGNERHPSQIIPKHPTPHPGDTQHFEQRPCAQSEQPFATPPSMSHAHKHRAPYRPVQTLSSPQKPSFKHPSASALDRSDESDDDASAVEYLGNSSSLFDEGNTASPVYALLALLVCFPPSG